MTISLVSLSNNIYIYIYLFFSSLSFSYRLLSVFEASILALLIGFLLIHTSYNFYTVKYFSTLSILLTNENIL